jgi:hypothetical protein
VNFYFGYESFLYSNKNGGTYLDRDDLSALDDIGKNYRVDIIRLNGTANLFIDGIYIGKFDDEIDGNINWWFGSYTGSGGTYTDCAFNNFEIRTTQNVQTIQNPTQNAAPQINPEKQNLLDQVQTLFPNIAVNPNNWGFQKTMKLSARVTYHSRLENNTYHTILDAPGGTIEDESYGHYLSTRLGSFRNFALHTDVTITTVRPADGYGDCYISYTDQEIAGEKRYKWFDIEPGYSINTYTIRKTSHLNSSTSAIMAKSAKSIALTSFESMESPTFLLMESSLAKWMTGLPTMSPCFWVLTLGRIRNMSIALSATMKSVSINLPDPIKILKSSF